jgi:geranylgeranyl pyrophosphate synthase
MLETSIDTFSQNQNFSPTDWQRPIIQELESVEVRLHEVPEGQNEFLTAASARLLSSGGKRIRPTLNLLAAGLFDTLDQHAISIAAAVEMLHTATLVHDDLIDRSLLRRGVSTLNADTSTDITVLTGDYLFARSANMVAEADNVRVMQLFSKTLMTILNGEINQRFSKWQIDRPTYYDRIYANGRNIGMAFQIMDDVLDFTGDQARIGKPVGSDLRQGIITLPAIYYIETNADEPFVQDFLNYNQRTDDMIQRMVEEISESDAIQEAVSEARRFILNGQRSLESFPSTQYSRSLYTLTEYIIERDL